MNLRKATKAQLIKEIKRLRGWEEKAIVAFNEISRREMAKNQYKKITPFAVVCAKILADKSKGTLKDTQEAWEHFWQILNDKIEKKYIDPFWAERTADLIEEYSKAIIFNETYIVNYSLPDRPERR